MADFRTWPYSLCHLQREYTLPILLPYDFESRLNPSKSLHFEKKRNPNVGFLGQTKEIKVLFDIDKINQKQVQTYIHRQKSPLQSLDVYMIP
jgi:hypothetical protein